MSEPDGINPTATPPRSTENYVNHVMRPWMQAPQQTTGGPSVEAVGLGSSVSASSAQASDGLNASGRPINSLNMGGSSGAVTSPSFEGGLSSYQVSSPTGPIPELGIDAFGKPIRVDYDSQGRPR